MEVESIARLVITPQKSAGVMLWGGGTENETLVRIEKTVWSLESDIAGTS